ncbi:MAG: gluzincin family metallopeptidase [Armatimonadota bacterium]
MLRIAWVLVCLAAGLPLAAATWVGYPAGGAVLYVRPGQERLAKELVPMTEQELSRIAGALDMTQIRSFPIFAYASGVDFLRDTGKQPDLLGQSQSPGGEIRIDVSGRQWSPRQVLAHEITHSLLDQRLGHEIWRLPKWVNEGIAGHLSAPVEPDQLEGVSRLIHRDGVLSLDEMNEAFPSGQYRDASYLQSRSMIAWLEWQHPGAVRRLTAALAAGQSFPKALRAAAGLTPEEWLSGWQRNVPAIFSWITFLASPAVYSPLAAILVWVAIRRILRKKAEEEEEEEESSEPEREKESDQLLEDM